jgi:hypothetical protein
MSKKYWQYLVITLIAVAPLPSFAGFLDSGKWVWATKRFAIDTEDVEIKGNNLRLYYQDDLGSRKLRIRCDKKDYRVERYLGWEYGWNASNWESLVDGSMFYEVASQLCFLTGIHGSYPEQNPPLWAEKIIRLKGFPTKKN